MIVTGLMLVSCACPCHKQTREQLDTAISQQIWLYPGQRLTDIYKYFFQSYLGTAYMVKDVNSAKRDIEKELSDSNQFDPAGWTELKPAGRYYRLNLSVIKNGQIPLDDFAAAFVKSVRPITAEDINQWKIEWAFILAQIEPHKSQIPDFDKDKLFIDILFQRGGYFVHHSPGFIRNYHPHYRVISKDQFDILRRKYRLYDNIE